MAILDNLGHRLFGTLIEDAVQQSKVASDAQWEAKLKEAVSEARLAVNEDWWAKLDIASRPQDKDWYQREQDLADVMEAWALNPFARRVVNLHTAHVVGRQLLVGSERPQIQDWIKRFWLHPKNKVYLEIYEWADELCRAGELFFVLFPNPQDGIPYIRAVPARRIMDIETDPEDYKRPLRYGEVRSGELDRRWWFSPEHEAAKNDPLVPVMVHYCINRPVGATRSWGGDLDTMLPWIKRYTEWLKDRVRINKARNAWVWKIKAANEMRVHEMERKYGGGLVSGSAWIGMGEEDVQPVAAGIEAGDAQDDGRALRQAMAVGGGVAPHFLGDVWQATRATAREANAPVFQAWAMRQHLFVTMLQDMLKTCMVRAHQMGKFLRWLPAENEWGWTRDVTDLTREDNLALAQAGKTIVDMLSTMVANEWVDRKTAITWAAKFSGEVVDPLEIMRLIDNPKSYEEIEKAEAQATRIEELSWVVGR